MLTPAVLAHLPPDFEIGSDIDRWMDERVVESAVYSVRDISDNGLLGLLILAEAGQNGARTDLHLGYLLGEGNWGKGLATELLASLVAAIEERGAWRLLGGVATDNPASARVLQKAGLHRDAALSTRATDMFTLNVGEAPRRRTRRLPWK